MTNKGRLTAIIDNSINLYLMSLCMPADLDTILERLNIAALNEMQLAALKSLNGNPELVLLAPTGSGKTLAYLIPLLQFLSTEPQTTSAVIIVPSRELALQIEKVFKSMGTGRSVTCCYGGHKRETEENNLIEAPSLIIGTPGRLADHIRRGNISVDTIRNLVLDEFDKSLELGFTEELTFIINALPNIERRILTSATMSDTLPDFIGLTDPSILHFDKAAGTPPTLSVQVVYSQDRDKLETLFKLLCYLGAKKTIIFCNHKESVVRCCDYLKEKDLVVASYYGAMEQRDRERALSKFRNGSSHFLVTTDLAARGLDIPYIRYIIHYHLPHTEAEFVHRNGRTARQDASGTAILLLSQEERLPMYISSPPEILTLPADTVPVLPERPQWATLYFSLGKKNKVNKVDIVGFLTNRGQLKPHDIGLIDMKDFCAFVAVRRVKTAATLHLLKSYRLKNKKVRIEVAK